MTSLIRQVFSPLTADDYITGHGDPSYDVTHYDLTLDYKLEGNRLDGKARIDAVAVDDLSQLTLDLIGLRATKVSIVGMGAVKHTARRGRLVLTPKNTIAAGRKFSVLITYGGSPQTVGDKTWEAGWEELTDGVIVAGQPGGAPSWFPCNDRPSNKAGYRMTITAPADYYVIANGRLVGRKRRASANTWVYDMRAPMASYLATVQIGRYVLEPVADRPVKVRAVISEQLAPELRSAFGHQAEMMALFVKLFGPYPFDDYTVVVTDDDLEIPLEAQGLSIFGRNFLKSNWDTVRLVAHELAHQWFGNSLTLERWRDIWLHEGFACYSEWLWSQESGIRSTHEQALEHWGRLAQLPQDLVVGDPGPELMFDDRVYKRGALTLHAIRLTVGEKAFFAMLRGWVAAHVHGTVTTDEFIAYASDQTGHDLTELCDSWLMQKGLPYLPRER